MWPLWWVSPWTLSVYMCLWQPSKVLSRLFTEAERETSSHKGPMGFGGGGGVTVQCRSAGTNHACVKSNQEVCCVKHWLIANSKQASLWHSAMFSVHSNTLFSCDVLPYSRSSSKVTVPYTVIVTCSLAHLWTHILCLFVKRRWF